MALIKSSPLAPFHAIKIAVTFCNLGWCKVDWHLLAQKYNLKLWNNGTTSWGNCQHFQIALLRRSSLMWFESALNVYLRKKFFKWSLSSNYVISVWQCHVPQCGCHVSGLPGVEGWHCPWAIDFPSLRRGPSPDGGPPYGFSLILPRTLPHQHAILVACVIFNQQSEIWAVHLPCNYDQLLAGAIKVPICARL